MNLNEFEKNHKNFDIAIIATTDNKKENQPNSVSIEGYANSTQIATLSESILRSVIKVFKSRKASDSEIKRVIKTIADEAIKEEMTSND